MKSKADLTDDVQIDIIPIEGTGKYEVIVTPLVLKEEGVEDTWSHFVVQWDLGEYVPANKDQMNKIAREIWEESEKEKP